MGKKDFKIALKKIIQRSIVVKSKDAKTFRKIFDGIISLAWNGVYGGR